MASIIKRSYIATLPDGTKQTRKCDHWTIQYRDAAGKIQRVKGYSDKGATKQLAAKIELQLARGEQVMIDPFKASKASPIAKHIRDYIADLTSTGRATKYIYVMERRLNVLAEECGWATLASIEANSFMRWRNERKKTGNPKGGNLTADGAAATTLNQFLESARAFTNWCAANKRMPGVAIGSRVISPILAGIAKAEGPAVRKRRALSDEEVIKVLAVTPPGRKLFSRVGLSLGLRRSELEQLKWGDVRLNAIKPYVQLRAEATKARRGDRLDIPGTLATELRTACPADAKDSDLVFPDPPTMIDWKADLAAAKINYKDAMDRRADFHAGTRKTLCSRMQRAGVPLAVAMRRMRHTDAKLTMVDYTDEGQIGMDVATLPELLPTASAPKSAVALA